MIRVHIPEPTDARDVPFGNREGMFLNVGVHVFQVRHENCRVADGME